MKNTSIDLRFISDQTRESRYEEECREHPKGYLNYEDVCELWSQGPEQASGALARRLVADLGLPLMHIGGGRWVVSYGLGGVL